jgi:hypothetical protein
LPSDSRLLYSTIEFKFDDNKIPNYQVDLVGTNEEDETKKIYINSFFSFAGVSGFSAHGTAHYYDNNNVKIADNKVYANQLIQNMQQEYKGVIGFKSTIGNVRYFNGTTQTIITLPNHRIKQANIMSFTDGKY